MLNTLKSKFTAVYICLVIITAIIGTASGLNTYSLSKSIDGLMVNNYKSINALNYMIEALEQQNNAILSYININHEQGIRAFNLNKDTFYKWYSVELNNITESGERELVEQLDKAYLNYINIYLKVQEVSNEEDTEKLNAFYKSNSVPTFETVKKLIKELSLLNETEMFKAKDEVTRAAKESMYIILIMSTFSVIFGFLAARISINRFLAPVYSLRETMKSVKEGDLNKEAKVISQDEVGDLTKEFNDMTKRLLLFEQSTIGKLIAERSMSLGIVKSISDPLIVLDNTYKIVLLNKACENIFDIEEEKVLNKYFLEVIKNGDLYDYINSVYNSQKDKTETKIIYIKSQKKDYYFNIIVTVLNDDKNKTAGVVVVFQNVTELKQIEKIKSDFIATISHEFKTPLTSLMIGTSLFFNEKLGPLNNKQKEVLTAISEDSEKLLHLVNDLLQMSKIESNRGIFDKKPNSVIGIIESSIKAFYEEAKNSDVKLYYEVDDVLPKVNVDFEKIKWVLNNLISNALKYTNAGDEILISAEISHNKMCILVKDTGMGIPEEYQEKIFEKFIQINRKYFEVKGTGLGLAIVKEIIEAHGGEIWCESKLDVGTTFTFTLPIAEVEL